MGKGGTAQTDLINLASVTQALVSDWCQVSWPGPHGRLTEREGPEDSKLGDMPRNKNMQRFAAFVNDGLLLFFRFLIAYLHKAVAR